VAFVGVICILICWDFVQGDTKKARQIVPDYQTLTGLFGDTENNETVTAFIEFAQKYGKTYPTQKEMVYRLNVFKSSVKKRPR